jgi:hypothetical protein
MKNYRNSKLQKIGNHAPRKKTLSWHTAFFDALRLELFDWLHFLEFYSEHPLNREPLRIDLLIIKKKKELVINKNIAAIFRKENILEFKSPEHSLSVADFHKVLAYAHLYYATLAKSNTSITDITVSFVTSRHPREALKHIQEVYGYGIEEERPGIYYIKGDVLPIQIIESRKLDEKENLWLRDLGKGLDGGQVGRLLEQSREKGKHVLAGAYLDVVLGANSEAVRRILGMKTFSRLLEEMGWTAQWEAQGEMRGESKKALEIVKRALVKGMPVEDIADLTGVDSSTIQNLKN